MICWTQEYSVNNEVIDGQHRGLFKILNELDQCIEKKEYQRMSNILTDLEVYALFHFSDEENAMEKWGYPDFNKHKKEHEEFGTTVQDFNKKTLEESAVCKEVLNYLLNWITNHIKVSDQAYTPYYK